eukprot:TRINITY_DN5180_c0_g1_i10.p1 TRINITY_DN5180_c0_g1~~TRINITY_DN5180_c0_g1_i10.p1  ORF type:complete len:458 (-),score=80.30 TRINITY_DN5180_c0_g1_i10:215-1471(-)
MKTEYGGHLATEEAKSLEGVIKVLETMFFSMPISEEIADKYNYLKEKKYKATGLKFVPITKAQYPSIGTAGKSCSAGKYQELENLFISLFSNQASLLETILKDIIDRGNQLVNLPKSPDRYSDYHSAGMNEIKAKIVNNINDYKHKRASIMENDEKGLKMSELFSGTLLQETVSQSIYKAELMHSQSLSFLDTLQDSISKHKSTVKGLNSELDLMNEAFRSKEAKFTSEIELLHKQLIRLEANINSEKIKASSQSDSIFMRKGLDADSLQLHESYKRQIEDLNRQHSEELKSMEMNLLLGRDEDKKAKYVERLEYVVRSMHEKLKAYYDIQRPLQSAWKDEDADTHIEEIFYAAFAIYCANKYEADCKWLSQRLQQCDKDNKVLQERANYGPSAQLFNKVCFYSNNSCLRRRKLQKRS